jgi:hypothetical protein
MEQFNKILLHYLGMLMRNAELGWGNDNLAEIEDAVYDLKEQIKEEVMNELSQKYELKRREDY